MARIDFPEEVQLLVSHLKRLPGIGPKSAERIAVWLIGQDGVVTIPHSGNPSRQRDNLAATAIVLSQTDLARLDAAIT